MPWNYRVFRTRYRRGYVDEGEIETFEEDVFTIREIYYNKAGDITGITAGTEGVTAVGETKLELQGAIQRMLSDSVWQTLTPKDIPGYTLEPGEISIPTDEL